MQHNDNAKDKQIALMTEEEHLRRLQEMIDKMGVFTELEEYENWRLLQIVRATELPNALGHFQFKPTRGYVFSIYLRDYILPDEKICTSSAEEMICELQNYGILPKK